MALPKKLTKKIEDFLQERSLSEGGFAPVKKDDLRQLSDILNTLIEMKYEEDPDGDVPVLFELVDRTKYQRAGFANLPHLHRMEGNLEEVMEAMRTARMNLSLAQGQVEHVFRYLDEDLMGNVRAGKPLAFGKKQYERFMPQFANRDEFRAKIKDRATELIEGVDLGALSETFEERQAFNRKMSEQMTREFDSPIEFSFYRGRAANADKFQIVLGTAGLAVSEGKSAGIGFYVESNSNPQVKAKNKP